MKDFPEACDNTVEVAAKCDVDARARAHPAEVPPARGRDRGIVVPQARARGPGKALRRPRCPSASRSRPTTRWASSSSRASRPTSSSCRSTSNGRAARASAWARAAARPPAPSWPTPWASPTLTRMPNGLMFERFLSPERVEMPDIDVDFEQGRREEVINHIKDVYGEDHVSQVITFGTLQAKNAVRDCGPRAGLSLRRGRPHLQDDRRRAGHHHRQGAGDQSRPEEGLRYRRGRASASSTPRSPSRATCAARACTPAPPSSAATP